MSQSLLRPRDAYRAWRSIQTRWADNDIYGHVNNVIHYSWFDTAVNGWMIDAGLLDVEAGATICLVVETGCRFAQSVAFPQQIEAGLRIVRLGGSSVRWEVGLFVAGAAEAAAEGFFVYVQVDRETRRPVPFDARWRAAMEALLVAEPSPLG